MKRAAVALLALSLSSAPLAMADSRHHDRGHRDHDRHHVRYDRHDHDRRHGRHHHVQHHHVIHHHGHAHGRWKRGDRLPWAYHSRHYVIHDYHVHHLRRPPHGYHWVRVGSDAVLAAIATGIVLEVLHDYLH